VTGTTDDAASSTGTSGDSPAPARIAPPPASSPTRSSRAGRDRGRRRRGLVLAGIAAALLLVAVAGLALSLSGGDDPEQGSEQGSAAPETSEEEPTTEPSPTESPSEDAGTSPAASQRKFVRDYLAAATSDPSASWEMLTPSFQEASGGFGSYEGFWSTNTSASVSDIAADPEQGQVTYTVTYEKTDGRTTAPETVTLQLVESDGRWLIADEL
jgi:eukaryotic-like serine/threonine-protein kinase